MDKERMILLGILLIGLLVRAPYVFQESVWNDETVYMWLGDQIRESPSFLFSEKVAYHSYGYLIDISTATLGLFMNSFSASRLATLAFSLLGIGLVYLLGKELTNQWGGAVAALIVALNPQHVFFSVRSLTDVYLATTLCLFAYAATSFDGSKRSGMLFGASVILAMMS
ncbi:MAG: glycosyltransferase family 39 protein, partial [Candidatus Altiarchaeota archaeon]|nr:glycosyltransferase family 39 protein [Candidatus Altiarchaeota archaeon]